MALSLQSETGYVSIISEVETLTLSLLGSLGGYVSFVSLIFSLCFREAPRAYTQRNPARFLGKRP